MKPEEVLTRAVALKSGFLDFEQFCAGLESGANLDPLALRAVQPALQRELQSAGGDVERALERTLGGLPAAVTRIVSGALAGVLGTGAREALVSSERTYVLGKLLGSGGAGEVYEGRDLELGREVALKFLRPDRATAAARARFVNEARIGALLEHPNVCPVYQTGVAADGRLFLVMRHVRGRSLDRQPGELSQRRLVEVLIQAAQGVAYAHSRGVLHRDIKPANIMLGQHGEVLVMDWGLAKASGDEDARGRPAAMGSSREWDLLQDLDRNLTAAGRILGTPPFMSPEQITGEVIDARSDVWALGVTLYELLTSHRPFAAPRIHELIARITTGDPTPPREHDPTIPADLESICLRCLREDPDERYASVVELLTDLRAFRDGRVVAASGGGAAARLRVWLRRNRALVGVATAATALVIAAGLIGGFSVLRTRARVAEREHSARRASKLRLVAQAQGEARLARERDALAASREEPRIGPALASLQAAQRWQVLAPEDVSAAQARYEAAIQLGEVARAAEQWELAVQAFSSAASSGVDDERARRRARAVEVEQRGEADRRRLVVTSLLSQAESGELARRPDGVNDAVFRIVRNADEATVALLASRLVEVADQLARVERGDGAQLAFRQLQVVGAGKLDLARVACRALGRIGSREAAVEALGRYLDAEADPDRAIVAGLALGRLGGERALGFLHEARERFGPSGGFSGQVERILSRPR